MHIEALSRSHKSNTTFENTSNVRETANKENFHILAKLFLLSNIRRRRAHFHHVGKQKYTASKVRKSAVVHEGAPRLFGVFVWKFFNNSPQESVSTMGDGATDIFSEIGENHRESLASFRKVSEISLSNCRISNRSMIKAAQPTTRNERRSVKRARKSLSDLFEYFS